jgi:hypothetical protein
LGQCGRAGCALLAPVSRFLQVICGPAVLSGPPKLFAKTFAGGERRAAAED